MASASSKHKVPESSHEKMRPKHRGHTVNNFDRKDGLGAYINDPESFPNSVVIYHNDSFVVINDAYPKSAVHTLLLPRDPEKVRLHPFDAFEDPAFLTSVKEEVAKLQKMVASELRRKFGKFSASERARTEAMNADPPCDSLPAGRDWEEQIIAGIHSGPSMNHLHIHVLTVDRFSECMKHRKHYNSFATPFFVRLDEFPLAADDIRRQPDRGRYLHADFVCWRCQKNFGNRFSKLKAHLDEEFDQWKAE